MRALLFVLQLVKKLNDLGQSITVIELVCGSLYEGFHGSKTNYFVSIADREEKTRRALGVLRDLVHKDKRAAEMVRGLKFALELEPGPLFVLSRWDDFRKLSEMIAEHELQEHVGLNLDICHWSTAGIRARLLSCECTMAGIVQKHVLHVHICDHGTGHLGDARLGDLRKESYFAQWLYPLASTSDGGERLYSQYDGYVSLELEACRDMGFVTDSCDRLKEWFDIHLLREQQQ